MVTLRLSQDVDADAFLADDPLALLVGMLLDQQFPMERAFGSPWLLATRMGVSRLDPAAIAAFDPEEFAALFATPPALHRYPQSMAARVQTLATLLVDDYDGDTARLWTTATSGAELLKRVKALPGFGEQKAKIFVALLGKQLGVRPAGWREAAGAYGEDGSTRSVADVTGPETLQAVREFKKAAKAKAKEAAQ
ncbi:HhH-GPD-type base excision DNA repair protein [Cryptosporangium phraense]|uniref:Fe-S cluster assembly protein HesB n=1 Tax=Cryptosporangium phraense TaxID=2593070 RepID=A0A545AIZ5_9ACTN|nr:HhH-GPD-type base excision DNA repair protein [Cryptosporangium phraense]TQS41294.1 Fe-S cluster assembly protein HesB [Cryptosporangium phraense]